MTVIDLKPCYPGSKTAVGGDAPARADLDARIEALEKALAHAQAALAPVRDLRLNGFKHHSAVAAIYGALMQATTRTEREIKRLHADLAEIRKGAGNGI